MYKSLLPGTVVSARCVGYVRRGRICTGLNLVPNQSIAIGYENRSPNTQDVQTTTLTVSEVWAP